MEPEDVLSQTQSTHDANMATGEVDQISQPAQNVVQLNTTQEGQDINLSPLKKNIQEIENDLSIIDNSTFSEYIDMLKDALENVPQTNKAGISTYLELFESLSSIPKKLNPRNLITWANMLVQFSNSIEKRLATFNQQTQVSKEQVQKNSQTPINEIQVDQTQVQQKDITVCEEQQHNSIFQYMQFRNNLDLQRKTQILSVKDKQTLDAYKFQGVIDKVTRLEHPCWPLQKLFVRNIRTKTQLTQDQCSYILDKITIQENNSFESKRQPFFNPDFQFQCTVFQTNNIFPQWEDFTELNKKSQMSLPQNKNLTELQVKAKFAFQQGCRWLLFTIDPKANMEINERVAFMIANDKIIKSNMTKVARAFLCRDAHTGAFDGQNIYYFIDDMEQFMTVYVRLSQEISPILRYSGYPIEIIAPSQPKIPSLPSEMVDLPPPHEYELILPISNSWHFLLRSQLTPEKQESFSPTIGFATVYIPQYSNPSTGVLGKVIKRMVKFQHLDVESESLYYWIVKDAKWEKRQSIEESTPPDYLDYVSYEIPTEEIQRETHEKTKIFSNQHFDLIRPRQYGSNHFWTLWNRIDKRSITKTPNTVFGDFSYGQNPFKPSIKSDMLAQKLLLQHINTSDANKDTIFQQHIEKESENCLEYGIKYHRLQSIQGFSSPFLNWLKPKGSLLHNRVPTIIEFLSMTLNQNSENFVRTLSLKPFFWIPKTITPHFDEETDKYYSSKRELQELRNFRIKQNAQQPQQVNNFLPSARKQNFPVKPFKKGKK